MGCLIAAKRPACRSHLCAAVTALHVACEWEVIVGAKEKEQFVQRRIKNHSAGLNTEHNLVRLVACGNFKPLL